METRIKAYQERLNKIKQDDKKSFYDMALDIGISQYSLYRLMIKNQLSENIELKIKEFLKDYETKNEQLEFLKKKYQNLKAENKDLRNKILLLEQRLNGGYNA